MSALIYPRPSLGPNGWDKERLEFALGQRFSGDGEQPYILPDRYYLDAEGSRAPEYAATHIRVRVFYASSRTPLDKAEEVVRRFAGLVELERIDRERDDLRPQIVALFERKPEREDDA